ncbi:DUF6174 domain-containing protein [Nocardioides antri]|uniref:Lipoprotein n=1 Tax=Nocardioides antri TaxID=2607659 RepID=A0A5B1LYI6_9ACTN|nr:DUF6174 domain-containing protein [Nocardioides antri]KAA1425742.1 hypothetical protein F0U47_18345 [Nocardioides antri]
MKILLSAAVAALSLTTLAGCSGGDDDGATAEDPASAPPATTESSDPTDEPTVGTYPELDAESYTYILEQICFCPLTNPVEVTVEDGEVTSAVIARGGQGLKKGSEAPEYLWITINDVIAQANDTDAADVEVDWPEGQEWPSRVAVDKVEMATDDEITYIVRNVRINEG